MPWRRQRFAENLETRVGTAEAVGKGHLHHVLVEIHDPLLERRDSAGHLRAERAAVEGVLKRDDGDLFRLPPCLPPGARQLDRAFARLGAGGQQEHLFEAPAAPLPAKASTTSARNSEGKQ